MKKSLKLTAIPHKKIRTGIYTLGCTTYAKKVM
jgi:hypothetical protein